jgi:pimeloyl-ACP methyl ester carboxylesterase
MIRPSMLRGVLRAARYARSWKVGSDVSTTETEVDRDGAKVAATLVLPRLANGSLPGWIALGGVSCMGRHHPQLVRFARALASSGAAVLVPEIPEWRRLELAPRAVAPTLRGCIDRLRSSGLVTDAPFGLIGFSFGAPQVAIAAARGDLAEEVGGIVLFGGYCSLERTMTCLLTGEHEWEGLEHQIRPDPFGGWVDASNHLRDVPGFEDANDVTGALHHLASAASGQRIPAWDPQHDPLIEQLRESLPHARRPLFDLFAVRSDSTSAEPEERRRMAVLLAEACRRAEPLLDPAHDLTRIDLPTRLIHGRGDRLIPFTEGLRLDRGLPERARRGVTVTGLFNHTADTSPAGLLERAREKLEMFSAIRGMINTV